MLWLLARLYATLPEVGDLDKPVVAFFFDEAHLLFDDASDALLEQVELTARLIRSKGVGVFFVTHAPTDVPSRVLGQLGNRIQHAVRAFTPEDADDLRKTARTFPVTAHYDVEEALTSLGIGEALVTVLSPDGTPSPLAWTRIVSPDSRMAPADEDVRARLVAQSPLRVKTFAAPDRESAAEILGARLASADAVAATPPPPGRRERSVFGTLHVSRR
jgi:DNA helicase HerA-like ATPase